MSLTDEELKEFVLEAEDLLDQAEHALLALDKGESLTKHYDAIFRAFHSLKGAAGMMDMGALQDCMHQMENLLTEKKPEGRLNKHTIDHFLLGTDAARKFLHGEDATSPTFVEEVTPQPEAASPVEAPTPVDALRTAAIVLPMAKEVEAPRGKLLIVDDEPELLSVMAQLLESSDLEVMTCSNGREALGQIAGFKPDCVLTDIAMPEMNGMELLKIVAKQYPDLPVIFLSGHVTKDSLLKAISSGIYAVIEKPFDTNHMIECCLNAVHKHQLMRLLNSSINLIMYQFTDLDAFLKSQGKEDVRKVIEREIHLLLEQRRKLKQMQKASAA